MVAPHTAEFSPEALLATWAGSRLPQERAAGLIVSTVVAFPQRDNVPLIIADALLCELDGTPGAGNGVRLTDVAELTTDSPDPALTAQCINTLHERSNVSFRLPPRIAAGFVYRCGLLSLEYIRQAGVFHAESEGLVVPAIMNEPIVASGISACEEQYNTSGVWALEAILRTEEEVRVGTASSIQELAEAARFEPPPVMHGFRASS